MLVTLLVGIGFLALAAVVVWSMMAMKKEATLEGKARDSFHQATARGAQPASLHPRIDLERCIGTGACVTACPEKDVIAVIDGQARLVNPTACIGHGECLRACPVDAIQLVLGTEKRGVDIPLVSREFETNVPGLYVVGELGGMGLIYNAMTQALQCLDAIAKDPPPKREGVAQVLVVGAGPAGIAASLAAKQHGFDHICLDQETMGGTVLHYPRHKLVMTKAVELPLYGKVRIGEIRKEDLLTVWQDIFTKTGLRVQEGVRVESIVKGDDGVFNAKTSAGDFQAQRVVLAIGRRGTPRKLGAPGEELGKVCYRLLDAERYAGTKVLVVGGGDAAVEAACTLAEGGVETTLSYRGTVFDRIKPKNQARLDATLGSLRVILSSQVVRIEPQAVVLAAPTGEARIDNDFVIVLIGGDLPTKFLQSAGVTVSTFKGDVYAPANR